ncbi:MAG: peptidoglycan-binding protein LysM [Candidatus Eremiobacteraeota bacterium]|nr:peptidoglycan-binding protein LysM [Candidatus Eremiobacteraeota bacterium]
MSMFDFVKTAGDALSSAIQSIGEESLKHKLEGSGLELRDLALKVDGDKVKIYAVVPDHETREKAILMVGNTPGVASVEDAIKVRPPAGAPEPAEQPKPSKFYTVESGDTLSAIAQKFYGDANQYMKIFEANRPMLSDPNVINPGQQLRIP